MTGGLNIGGMVSMPTAEAILRHLQGVVDEALLFSLIMRLMFVALVAILIVKRRVYPEYLAAFVALVMLSAGGLAVSFEENTNLATFALLMPLALLWGREALSFSPRPANWPLGIAAAGALTLFALFYPHFVYEKRGVAGVLLFAPFGVAPCPSLIFAQAAIIATRRSYTLYVVIPTWLAGAFYGAVGVFYLKVEADIALLAAVAASVLAYALSAPLVEAHKGRKFKRRH